LTQHISSSDLEELNALNPHVNYTPGKGHTNSLLVDPPPGSLIGEEDVQCLMHLDPTWVPDEAYVSGPGDHEAQGAKANRRGLPPLFRRRTGSGKTARTHTSA